MSSPSCLWKIPEAGCLSPGCFKGVTVTSYGVFVTFPVCSSLLSGLGGSARKIDVPKHVLEPQRCCTAPHLPSRSEVGLSAP